MDELSLENTLLGIDAVYNEQLLGQDRNEQQILALLADYNDTAKIVITAIGGQGHILGRGNQQLSPAVIRQVGAENIIVVATKTKITELNGRPLLVDTNDVELDVLLRGYRSVVTGYHDAIIYPVGVVE
jgi:predicted polyphosphate/ATP-dependent NAD kinase